MNANKEKLITAIQNIQADEEIAIRKLTVREVGRLMDVRDSDIDKMIESGVSKSGMYKCFGNSIVVSCMEYIFEQLFYPVEQKKEPGYQYTIEDYL